MLPLGIGNREVKDLGTGGKGASGTGSLFNLNFRSLVAGETRLEVNRVNFRNPEGVRLQVVPGTVAIEIR